jgi:GNAT superfamily N-acetyltransferase
MVLAFPSRKQAQTVQARRIFLQLSHAGQFRPVAHKPDLDVRFMTIDSPTPELFRHLYDEVGRDYNWVDRIEWDDARINAFFATDTTVRLVLMFADNKIVGFHELVKCADGSVEISLMGLLPPYHGQGLGGCLLTHAVETAWRWEANRVWLHTCSFDAPAALPNYLKRGFEAYREQIYYTPLRPDYRLSADYDPFRYQAALETDEF